MHEQMPEDRRMNLEIDITGRLEEEEQRRLYSWLVVCDDSMEEAFFCNRALLIAFRHRHFVS